MGTSPCCHEHAAPKTIAGQVIPNNDSPSSSQVVLSIPSAPYFWPSRTKFLMLMNAASRFGKMRFQLLAPGDTKMPRPASLYGLSCLSKLCDALYSHATAITSLG